MRQKKTNYISELDTWRFGFRIARTENLKGDPQKILDELQRQDVKLFIARVDSNDISTINILESMGFEYKDTQLKYRLPLTGKEKQNPDPEKKFWVRAATEKDVDKIVTISGEAFYNHGHYFADRRLDRNKCIEIYKDWARRCCLDKDYADIVFAAENENGIIGFLSYKILKDGDILFSRTGLGAMKQEYRGIGVYSEILKYGRNWGIDLKLDREEHFVLATNIPINNLFVKKGFKLFGGFITFHYWLDTRQKRITDKYIDFKWDSGFFGFRVAKLIPDNISTGELSGLLGSLKKDSFKLVYLFLDPLDKAFNRSALDSKGLLVDEKVTYSMKLEGSISEDFDENIKEYTDKMEDLNDQISSLSIQAGTYSRFKKDPNLKSETFESLYSIWAKNSLNGMMADKVFVYKKGKAIKGFITLRFKKNVGEIVLIGVAHGARGTNIGSSMMNRAKTFFLDKGISKVMVVTQKENFLACKFYEKNGFTIEKIQNVYHFWL